MKVKRFENLASERCSKSNVRQRKGRAGRCVQGVAVTMMTEAEYEVLHDAPTPEMQRTSLTTVILPLMSAGLFKHTEELPDLMEMLPSPPLTSAVTDGIKNIEDLHAVCDGQLRGTNPTGTHRMGCKLSDNFIF